MYMCVCERVHQAYMREVHIYVSVFICVKWGWIHVRKNAHIQLFRYYLWSKPWTLNIIRTPYILHHIYNDTQHHYEGYEKKSCTNSCTDIRCQCAVTYLLWSMIFSTNWSKKHKWRQRVTFHHEKFGFINEILN